MKLNPKALGLTLAIFAALCWLILMSVSLLTGYAKTAVVAVGSFHPFFSYSWTGLIWMVVQHFIGGFIVGWLFGWVYNRLVK
jgi:hypothetical protein